MVGKGTANMQADSSGTTSFACGRPLQLPLILFFEIATYH